MRKLATKLILSGALHSIKGPPDLLKSPVALTPLLICVPGELDTFETLSSDMQKNVLSALRRLEIVRKTMG